MSSMGHMTLGKLHGHARVHTSAATTWASRSLDVPAIQRRFRHTVKPYTCPQRLRAPAKGYKAVRARRLLQDKEQSRGARFSHVTVKPKEFSKHTAHYLRCLGFALPDSKATLRTVDLFKKGLKTKLSTLSALFGWTPVQWPGSILYIDLANCGGLLNVRNLHKSVTWSQSVLNDLVQFSQVKGCRVHVMVEGRHRSLSAPSGIQMIRAQPIRRKDIGDDAIVECVDATVKDGIEPSQIVLITDDRGLIRRMPLGVKRRSPKWLALEILDVLADQELDRLHVRAPSTALDTNNTAVMRISDNSGAKTSSLDSGSAWREWWRSLASLRTLLCGSFFGRVEGRRRGLMAVLGSSKRS